MAIERKELSPADIDRQLEICARLRAGLTAGGARPLALVDTYGCQQNEADSERLRGYLREMGFGFTEDEHEADVIVINTCAVREHAEQRVLGNVGALGHTKRAKPGQLIALCGCMVERPGMAERIRRSYRLVDLAFGPQELWRFPALLEQALARKGRVCAVGGADTVAEGLPVCRREGPKAWLPVMYGCNNFCSYCVVPYVRGRERSRRPEAVLDEARRLIGSGVHDITLLGQNVNSYGRDLDGADFPSLVRAVCALDGDFLVRFMTSHPKDATEALFRAMAESEKCARHLHLPVQAGSDRILRAMNRHYDRASYLEKVACARALMPELVLTTDIIVGFPGETEEDFADTLSLVEQVEYDAMFTFLFSPRPGTPAAELPDPTPREEKQARFDRLLETANAISARKHAAYVGTTQRVLVDGTDEARPGTLCARTNGGRLVRFAGGAQLVGTFADVRITGCSTWALDGTLCGE